MSLLNGLDTMQFPLAACRLPIVRSAPASLLKSRSENGSEFEDRSLLPLAIRFTVSANLRRRTVHVGDTLVGAR
jgi:hypothetical protein